MLLKGFGYKKFDLIQIYQGYIHCDIDQFNCLVAITSYNHMGIYYNDFR